MRSAAPALLLIFQSRLQADILAAPLLDAEEEHSLTDLARLFDAPPSTVHGEVKRLTEVALLRRRSVGGSALVRANMQNRLVEPLTELLLLSWGPMQVVTDEFAAHDRPVLGAVKVVPPRAMRPCEGSTWTAPALRAAALSRSRRTVAWQLARSGTEARAVKSKCPRFQGNPAFFYGCRDVLFT